MTIQQLQDELLQGVNLDDSEKQLITATFGLKYMQELLGYLTLTGILNTDDITQIMTLLDNKIQGASEEKKASLHLDETLRKMKVSVLGTTVGALTAEFEEEDKNRIQQNLQQLSNSTGQPADTE